MAKPKKIKLDQILARRTKGYAFGSGTAEEKMAYRERIRQEIETDFAQMSEEDFRTKYEQYIY